MAVEFRCKLALNLSRIIAISFMLEIGELPAYLFIFQIDYLQKHIQ